MKRQLWRNSLSRPLAGEGDAHGSDGSAQGLHLLANSSRAKGSSIGTWQRSSQGRPAAGQRGPKDQRRWLSRARLAFQIPQEQGL